MLMTKACKTRRTARGALIAARRHPLGNGVSWDGCAPSIGLIDKLVSYFNRQCRARLTGVIMVHTITSG